MNTLPEIDPIETPDARPGSAPRNPLQIAWQRKALVVLGVVVGLAGGIIAQSRRAPVYQTSAQVLVVKKRADALPIAGSESQGSYYDDYIATHLVLIRSPLIVERAVKKHNLGSLATFAGQGDPSPTIIGSLTAARGVKEFSNTNFINLSYKGPVAEDCPVILGAVIDSYKDFLDETYRNVSDDTLKLIEKARDLLDRDLKEKRKKYRDFRENSPLVAEATPKDGVTPSQARLGELESKRLVLLVRAAEIEERLRAVENARKQGTTREVVQALSTAPALDRANAGNPDQALRLALLPLLLEEQALLEDYAEDHPQVKAVRRKLKMTRDLYESASTESEVSGAVDPVEAFVKALKQEQVNVDVGRQALVRLAGEEQKKSKELRHYEDEDEEFRNEITQTHALWDQTIKRLQEINVVRDFGGYSVQMISSPGEGGIIGTPAMQTVLAGVCVGLLLGIGLAYLADRADKSFRSPEEIRRRLGLPVVAHLPVLADEQAMSSPDAPQLDGWLACYHRPASPEGEVYRSLRTAVFFSLRGEVHKVIQVTSANMGDGKSTIAANLAIVIAQSGKRVVLVDADLRRPRVHTLFGVRSPTGLSSVIAGTAELSAALLDSGVDHLSLLVCGPRPTNPAELLTQPRFEQILGELRKQFDFIIVDTPPLMAVTDPCVVASRVDGVLLTVRLGKDGRPAAERAVDILRTLNAKVLGVIVNGVGGVHGRYGYEHYRYKEGYLGHYETYTEANAEANGETNAEANAEANGTATATAVAGTGRARKRHRKKSAGWIARWFR